MSAPETDEKARLQEVLRAAEQRASAARKTYAKAARARKAGQAVTPDAIAELAKQKHEAEAILEAARRDAAIASKTGTSRGIVATEDGATGVVSIALAPGMSKQARDEAVAEALGDPLEAIANELGVVLSAAPTRYARERPGRDAEGRTVFDVSARVEGDYLAPGPKNPNKR